VKSYTETEIISKHLNNKIMLYSVLATQNWINMINLIQVMLYINSMGQNASNIDAFQVASIHQQEQLCLRHVQNFSL